MQPHRLTVHVNAKVAWKAIKSAESRMWVGVCDELNISTEAASLDELHSIIPEAIHLLMSDLLADNELEAFLQAKGWKPKMALPAAANAEEVDFDLPWQMITDGHAYPQSVAH